MTVLRLAHLYTAEGPFKFKDIDVIHVIHVIHVANEAAAKDEAAAEDDAGTKHEAAAEEAWYSVSRMTVLRLTHLHCRRTPQTSKV